MKASRKLSGIFFRYENPETGKMENRTFEDLPEEKQDEILQDRPIEWVKSLAKQLADSLNHIGDQLDIELRDEED